MAKASEAKDPYQRNTPLLLGLGLGALVLGGGVGMYGGPALREGIGAMGLGIGSLCGTAFGVEWIYRLVRREQPVRMSAFGGWMFLAAMFAFVAVVTLMFF